ncbi:hypothetical protein MMC14_003007 [Varicellaria rhodocarpa]|nr:hypothetical protein [Varicellaria rhodocarpa]
MDAAAQGASALASKDFSTAITCYTRAISSNPQAVDYYIKRSTAYARVSPPDYVLALSDAEVAVVLAQKRGKREFIALAQLRRGIALFGLERWADAGACFAWVKNLTPKEGSLAIWEKKIEGKLSALKEKQEAKAFTIKEFPQIDTEGLGRRAKATEKEVQVTEKPITTGGEKKVEGVQTPANKIRHEWYQTHDIVVVTLFAKGIPRDKAMIDIQPRSLAFSFPLPTGADYDFTLEPLFSSIDSSSSTHKIMSTKAEFVLQKATPGQKWASLEGTEPISNTQTPSDDTSDPSPNTGRAILKPTDNLPSAPSYPTSSKSGPKNWDKLATDLTKPKKNSPSSSTDKPQEEDEYDSDEGGDAANSFFKKLFKSSNPDTQRAMMKSFQESNGTALSTNWADVSKGKMETTPPDGMVARKWGE